MSYTAPVYLLQPGQRETIPVVGREVVVIEADKDFLIATNSGEPQFITAGLQLAPDGGFSNIVMRNPHAEAISVRLGITDGSIKDNRASVSTVLPVRDPDDLTSFSDVIAALADVEASQAAILAMMQNANDQKLPIGDCGASFASGQPNTTAVQLIDPLVNTAGVILRTASVLVSATGSAGFCVGVSAPGSVADRAVLMAHAGANALPHPLLLPSGQGLWIRGASNDGYYSARWDVL